MSSSPDNPLICSLQRSNTERYPPWICKDVTDPEVSQWGTETVQPRGGVAHQTALRPSAIE